MSREVIIKIRDDLDQSDADETIDFAYRGQTYEIDLSSANAELFDKSLKQFIDAARTVVPPKPVAMGAPAPKASPAVKLQRREIRAWAAAHGEPVSEKGLIRGSVVEAYQAANPWVELLPGVIPPYGTPSFGRQSASEEPVTAQQADEEGLISAADLLTKYDKTARDPKGRPLTQKQRTVIRVWANENGFDQAMTGQIKDEVLEAYWAAKKGPKRGN